VSQASLNTPSIPLTSLHKSTSPYIHTPSNYKKKS